MPELSGTGGGNSNKVVKYQYLGVLMPELSGTGGGMSGRGREGDDGAADLFSGDEGLKRCKHTVWQISF